MKGPLRVGVIGSRGRGLRGWGGQKWRDLGCHAAYARGLALGLARTSLPTAPPIRGRREKVFSLRSPRKVLSLRSTKGTLPALVEEGILAALAEEGALAALVEEGALAALVDEGILAALVEEGTLAALDEKRILAALDERGFSLPSIARRYSRPSYDGLGESLPAALVLSLRSTRGDPRSLRSLGGVLASLDETSNLAPFGRSPLLGTHLSAYSQ